MVSTAEVSLLQKARKSWINQKVWAPSHTPLPNIRKTSFEKSLPSGSHHPLHLSARHARPWEKRSSVWYVLPVPLVVVT